MTEAGNLPLHSDLDAVPPMSWPSREECVAMGRIDIVFAAGSGAGSSDDPVVIHGHAAAEDDVALALPAPRTPPAVRQRMEDLIADRLLVRTTEEQRHRNKLTGGD